MSDLEELAKVRSHPQPQRVVRQQHYDPAPGYYGVAVYAYVLIVFGALAIVGGVLAIAVAFMPDAVIRPQMHGEFYIGVFMIAVGMALLCLRDIARNSFRH